MHYNIYIMTILGIDYGKKNIGLAISDEMATFAGALPILNNVNDERSIESIIEIINKSKVDQILLGLPMQNTESEICKHIKNFGKNLEEKSNKKVIFWDESYSSKIIQKNLRGKRKKQSDSFSAELILQEYLDYLSENKK